MYVTGLMLLDVSVTFLCSMVNHPAGILAWLCLVILLFNFTYYYYMGWALFHIFFLFPSLWPIEYSVQLLRICYLLDPVHRVCCQCSLHTVFPWFSVVVLYTEFFSSCVCSLTSSWSFLNRSSTTLIFLNLSSIQLLHDPPQVVRYPAPLRILLEELMVMLHPFLISEVSSDLNVMMLWSLLSWSTSYFFVLALPSLSGFRGWF